MRAIRKRIEEKKQGLYTDEEIREIAEHRLDAVLDAHEFNSDFISDFRSQPGRWNYHFGPETIYRSSRGGVGGILESIRGVLRPLQKLFLNPNPLIAALSRQSDLNTYYVHLLHSLAGAITSGKLEVQDRTNRSRQLPGRLEFQARREKTLEEMVVCREDGAAGKDGGAKPGSGGGGGASGGGGGAAGNEPA